MPSSFWNALSDTFAAVAMRQQARDEVRAWVSLRRHIAEKAMAQYVSAAVAQQNANAIAGAPDEFAEQIKLVDSWELQQEDDALLWCFKERVGAELAATQARSEKGGKDLEHGWVAFNAR